MKHVRVWVEYGPEDGERTFGHPMSCTERNTVCSACGCCEHCYHDGCSCPHCDCADPVIIYPPRVIRLEDET
jgi:hypothetical protein